MSSSGAEETAGETARKLEGQARDFCAGCAETLRAHAADQPLTALAVAAGVGFLLGVIAARR